MRFVTMLESVLLFLLQKEACMRLSLNVWNKIIKTMEEARKSTDTEEKGGNPPPKVTEALAGEKVESMEPGEKSPETPPVTPEEGKKEVCYAIPGVPYPIPLTWKWEDIEKYGYSQKDWEDLRGVTSGELYSERVILGQSYANGTAQIGLVPRKEIYEAYVSHFTLRLKQLMVGYYTGPKYILRNFQFSAKAIVRIPQNLVMAITDPDHLANVSPVFKDFFVYWREEFAQNATLGNIMIVLLSSYREGVNLFQPNSTYAYMASIGLYIRARDSFNVNNAYMSFQFVKEIPEKKMGRKNFLFDEFERFRKLPISHLHSHFIFLTGEFVEEEEEKKKNKKKKEEKEKEQKQEWKKKENTKEEEVPLKEEKKDPTKESKKEPPKDETPDYVPDTPYFKDYNFGLTRFIPNPRWLGYSTTCNCFGQKVRLTFDRSTLDSTLYMDVTSPYKAPRQCGCEPMVFLDVVDNVKYIKIEDFPYLNPQFKAWWRGLALACRDDKENHKYMNYYVNMVVPEKKRMAAFNIGCKIFKNFTAKVKKNYWKRQWEKIRHYWNRMWDPTMPFQATTDKETAWYQFFGAMMAEGLFILLGFLNTFWWWLAFFYMFLLLKNQLWNQGSRLPKFLKHTYRVFGFIFVVATFYLVVNMLRNYFKRKEKEKGEHNHASPMGTEEKAEASFYIVRGILKIFTPIFTAMSVDYRIVKEAIECVNGSLDLLRGITMFRKPGRSHYSENHGDPFGEPTDVPPTPETESFFREFFKEEHNPTQYEKFKKFVNEYKWWITGGVVVLMGFSLIVYIFMKDDDETENEGGKYKNWRERDQKRKMKVLDRDAPQVDYNAKHREYLNMKQDEEEKRLAFSRGIADAGEKAGEIPQIDYRPFNRPSDAPKRMDPIKLLNYDVIMVRAGPFDVRFARGLNREQRAKFLAELQRLISYYGYNDFMVKTQDAERKTMWVSPQGVIANESVSVSQLASYFHANGITATTEEIEEIQKAKDKRVALFKFITPKALESIKKVIVENESQMGATLSPGENNHALLGSTMIRADKIVRAIVPFQNPYESSSGQMVAVSEPNSTKVVFYTCFHCVSNIPNTKEEKEIIGRKFENENGDRVEVTEGSKDADYAILTVAKFKEVPPSFVPHMENYQGPAFMIFYLGGKLMLAMGTVFKTADFLYHNIPTTPGVSGAAIISRDLRLLGIHKGTDHRWNIGVSVNNIVNRLRFPIRGSLNHSSVEQDIDLSLFDFTYLKEDEKPKFFPFSQDRLPASFLEHVGKNYELICAVQAYNHLPKDDIMSPFDQTVFGLPDPTSSHHRMAIPTFETIHKDVCKYTREYPRDICEGRYMFALRAFKDYLNWIHPGTYEKMTHEETREGMNAGASTGFVSKRVISKKGDYYDQRSDVLQTFTNGVASGKNYSILGEAGGKKELRPIEKILDKKVRSYVPTQVHLFHLEKTYFGHFLNNIQENPFYVTNTTLGTGPFYGAWQEMVRYLNLFPTPLSKIDFPQWDSRFFAILLDDITSEVIKKCNIPEEERFFVRKWLYENVAANIFLVIPISLLISIVIRVWQGMTSGRLVTFCFNSFGNIFRHFYCLADYYFKDYDYVTLMRENVFLACGDDFAFGTAFELDKDLYLETTKELGYPIEEWEESPEIDFAGLGTKIESDGTIRPIVNLDRLFYNLSILKRSMSLPDYIQKLDNLGCVVAGTDPSVTARIYQMRDAIITMFISDPAVLTVASGCADLEQAIAMHQSTNEVGPLKLSMPHKNQRLELNHASVLRIRYHGNWCGPFWSNGEHQESVFGSAEAIDGLDQLCKEHDFGYAAYRENPEVDIDAVDERFIEEAGKFGIKGKLASYAVMAAKATRKKKAGQTRKKKMPKTKIRSRPGPRKVPRIRMVRKGRRLVEERAVTAPVAVAERSLVRGPPRVRMSSNGNTLTVAGSMFVSNVTTSSSIVTPVQGDTVFKLDICPSQFAGSRLQVFNSLYERFRFKRLRMRYIPSVPATTTGSLIGFIDLDPSDENITGLPMIQSASETPGFGMAPVWTPFHFSMVQRGKKMDYWTDGESSDVRLTRQGTINVIANSNLSANTTYGQLEIDYVCEFYQAHNQSQGSGYSYNGYSEESDMTIWFGGAETVYNTLEVSVEYVSSKVYQFTIPTPRTVTHYVLVYTFTGTNFTAAGSASITTGQGVINVGTNAAGTVVLGSGQIRNEAGSGSIVFKITGGTSTTLSQSSVFLIQVPSTSNVYMSAEKEDFLMVESETDERIKQLEDKLSSLLIALNPTEVVSLPYSRSKSGSLTPPRKGLG